MTRTRRRLALLLAGVASACAGLNPGSDDGCKKSCETAYLCGFLPSILGYAATAELAIDDCKRRCGQSPRNDDHVAVILACLQGTGEPNEDLKGWCLDPGHDKYADGLTCDVAASCLAAELKGTQLASGVSLNVSMISFADYEAAFVVVDGTVAKLYDDDTSEVQSCTPALCGPADCMRSHETDRPPCDYTMCRNTNAHTAQICDQLQVAALDINVEGRNGAMAMLELLDETDSTACKQATAIFDNATYHLNPGPARVSARFHGELPPSEIAKLLDPEKWCDTGDTGDTGATGDTDDAPVKYCVEFIGMSVTLRSGENAALVPIGGVDEVCAYGARPRNCNP